MVRRPILCSKAPGVVQGGWRCQLRYEKLPGGGASARDVSSNGRRLLRAETRITGRERKPCYSSVFSGSVLRDRADRTNIHTKMHRGLH